MHKNTLWTYLCSFSTNADYLLLIDSHALTVIRVLVVPLISLKSALAVQFGKGVDDVGAQCGVDVFR